MKITSNTYRSDIDGLRAIAVLPVVFFHLGVNFFSGGYVGVDIFFVISGYLITSIIVKDVVNDNFNIVNFYERRIRRIFPALFTMIFISSIVAYFILIPSELKDFGQSVFAATYSFSNILFWHESGYFDGPAEIKPLLHTWSLAVEEQFYLVYPVLLYFFIKKFSSSYKALLFVILILSLLICVLTTSSYPTENFYLTPSRGWELLLGALLALNVFPADLKKYYREMLAVIGLCFVLYSVIFFDKNTEFPGAAALVPCLGAALIIYSGSIGKTFIGEFLSSGLLIKVGVISYSLYLWHWPIIVYTKLYLQRPLQNEEIVYLIVLMFILAFISWRYIEQPFRGKNSKFSKKIVFQGATFVVIISTVFGLYTHFENGISQRLSKNNLEIVRSISQYSNIIDPKCFYHENTFKNYRNKLCSIGESTATEKSFILWGDSHARALIPAVRLEAKIKGLSGYFAGHVGCPPLLDVIKSSQPKRTKRSSCRDFNNAIIKFITSHPEIKTVILTARWVVNLEGVRLPTDPNLTRNVYLYDDLSTQISTSENKNVFQRGLFKTIRKLQSLGKKVVIFGPVPELDVSLSSALVRSSMLGISRDFRPDTKSVNLRLAQTLNLLDMISNKDNISVLYPHEILCETEKCDVEINKLPIYRDDDHLSIYGAEYLYRKLAVKKKPLGVFFNK